MNKPGYQTTEFWLSLAGLLLGGLMSSGVINAKDSEEVGKLIAPVISSFVPLAIYVWGRVQIKANAPTT